MCRFYRRPFATPRVALELADPAVVKRVSEAEHQVELDARKRKLEHRKRWVYNERVKHKSPNIARGFTSMSWTKRRGAHATGCNNFGGSKPT